MNIGRGRGCIFERLHFVCTFMRGGTIALTKCLHVPQTQSCQSRISQHIVLAIGMVHIGIDVYHFGFIAIHFTCILLELIEHEI